MLTREVYALISLSLRRTADKVDEYATKSETNPDGAAAALGTLMLGLSEICRTTAQDIGAGMVVMRAVRDAVTMPNAD